VKTFGPTFTAILFAGFALLLWLAFDTPEILTAALVVGVLIFLIGAFTGKPIR
jgi:hypothetical protein